MRGHVAVVDSPLGPIEIEVDDAGRVLRAGFTTSKVSRSRIGEHTGRVAAQLREYFEGRRRSFDLELAPVGTPFQRKVWQALLAIPFGSTATYAELARSIGQPLAFRAVGQANGRNPIPIIIPCHRAVATGGLGGYSAGEDRKRFLLHLEGCTFVAKKERGAEAPRSGQMSFLV